MGTTTAIRKEKAAEARAEDVYRAARSEWLERYGGYIVLARAFFVLALGSLVVAGGAVYALYSTSRQSKIVPYVVEIDKLGAAVAIAPAEKTSGVSDKRVIKAYLAQWLRYVREVIGDPAAERAQIEFVYAGLNKNGAAFGALNEHFRAHSPFSRMDSELVTIQLRSVLPVSEDTWRIEWEETVRKTEGGAPTGPPEWWQGTFTIALSPPTDEGAILKNPLGVYVNSYSWAKRL